MYGACLVLLRFLLFDVGQHPLGSLPPAVAQLPFSVISVRSATARLAALPSVTHLSANLSELDILRYLQHTGAIPPPSVCDLRISTVVDSFVRYYLLDGRCVLSVVEWREGLGGSDEPKKRACNTQAILILRYDHS